MFGYKCVKCIYKAPIPKHFNACAYACAVAFFYSICIPVQQQLED